MNTKKGSLNKQKLLEDNLNLRARLDEAEETLRAIREGEVDAIVVSGSRGDQVFSLNGADSVYRLIVETMKEAAVTVAFDGTILFFNNQFSELVCSPQGKILGKHIEDFVVPEERPLLASLIQNSRIEPMKGRVQFDSQNGKHVPAHVSANVLHQPDGVSICIVATDLTELESSTEMLRQLRYQREALAQSESQYRELVGELEKRVHERTAELSKAIEQLNTEISRRRSTEEELRARGNQLSRMASQLTIAEERERRRITEILHDNVQQLLVGAKLRVAGLRRKPGDVKQVAEELETVLSQTIDLTRSLTSELSPPILRQSGFVPALEWLSHWMRERHGLEVELRADRDLIIEDENTRILLFQSIRELLFNVVKHSGVLKARITVDYVQDQLRILVSDQGVGFDPNPMGGPDSRFGLFSIQERLDSMGGCMQREASPGKGCQVLLIVPLHSREEPERSLARGDVRQIRILVVDDHVIMRQGLAHLLRSQPDMDVVGEASDGQAAVFMARQCLPDVIIMDMSMPILSGPDATRIIHSEMPDVQVIGLSMFEEEEKAEIMRRAGAVRYLTKTGPSDQLIAAIRETAIKARQRAVTH